MIFSMSVKRHLWLLRTYTTLSGGLTLYVLLTSFMNITRNLEIAPTDGASASILGPNTMTGAGVVGAGTTVVASTMLLSTAMPVQVIGSLALAGGCYAIGVLQDKGKLPNFFAEDVVAPGTGVALETAAPAA